MIYVPPGARTGDNVLFATKVMAPIDGPVRENVGLLGSPAFEIPRASARDLEMLGRHRTARSASAASSRKTWFNLASMAGPDRLALADRVPGRLRVRLDGGGLWRQRRRRR